MDDKPLEKVKPESIDVNFDALKIIPKLVTKIGISKSEGGNYVLTLICNLPDEPAQLVERIIVDSSTADMFVKVLNKAKEA